MADYPSESSEVPAQLINKFPGFENARASGVKIVKTAVSLRSKIGHYNIRPRLERHSTPMRVQEQNEPEARRRCHGLHREGERGVWREACTHQQRNPERLNETAAADELSSGPGWPVDGDTAYGIVGGGLGAASTAGCTAPT